MREYLYTLEIDTENTATSKPSELFLLYAVDDEDAMNKARKRVDDWQKVRMILKRCTGHFTIGHREIPPFIDTPGGVTHSC
jgi:hypothetical protein